MEINSEDYLGQLSYLLESDKTHLLKYKSFLYKDLSN